MNNLHAALVGCGKFASRTTGPFGPGYGLGLRGSRFQLHAAVDCDEGRALQFTRQFGGRPFKSLSRALSSVKPQLLIIATSDASHAGNLVEALEHEDCPQLVIVEKPICATASEWPRISKLASERGAKVVVNHTRRFSPWYRNLRLRIQQGHLGRLIEARATFYGGWLHNGVHVVDTLHFLFGERAVMTSAGGYGRSSENVSASQSYSGNLGAGGCSVSLSEFLAGAYQIFEFDLRFEEYRLQIDDYNLDYRLRKATPNSDGELLLGETNLQLGPLRGDSMQVLLDEAANYLEFGSSTGLEHSNLDTAFLTMTSMWSLDLVGNS